MLENLSPTEKHDAAVRILAIINADAKSLGLGTDFSAGDDGPLNHKLNASDYDDAYNVPNDPIQTDDFLTLINGDESEQIGIPESARLSMYLTPGSIRIGDSNIQSMLGKIFTPGATPISHAAIVAKGTRPGSLIEHEFGTGFRTTDDDVAYVRQNQGSL